MFNSNISVVYFKVLVGFADPSNLDDNPGWPLRNFLTLISYHWYVFPFPSPFPLIFFSSFPYIDITFYNEVVEVEFM